MDEDLAASANGADVIPKITPQRTKTARSGIILCFRYRERSTSNRKLPIPSNPTLPDLLVHCRVWSKALAIRTRIRMPVYLIHCHEAILSLVDLRPYYQTDASDSPRS